MNGTIFESMTDCNDKECLEFKVKDFIETLGNYFSFLLFNATNCSQFYTALYIEELGPDGNDRNFHNVTFRFVKEGLCRIRWHEQSNITSYLKAEELD